MTTKKDMEEKVEELLAKEAAWQVEKEQIIEQAQLLQKEHNRRLMYLRLMEKFANDVDRAIVQLKSDINEVNATLDEEQTVEAEQTGEEL